MLLPLIPFFCLPPIRPTAEIKNYGAFPPHTKRVRLRSHPAWWLRSMLFNNDTSPEFLPPRIPNLGLLASHVPPPKLGHVCAGVLISFFFPKSRPRPANFGSKMRILPGFPVNIVLGASFRCFDQKRGKSEFFGDLEGRLGSKGEQKRRAEEEYTKGQKSPFNGQLYTHLPEASTNRERRVVGRCPPRKLFFFSTAWLLKKSLFSLRRLFHRLFSPPFFSFPPFGDS